MRSRALAREERTWHCPAEGRPLRKSLFMRVFLAAAIAAAVLSPTMLAAAEEMIDASTLDAVSTLATKGYQRPTAASIRHIHKSKARNGLGYCGEVSLEGGAGFTPFHAILAAKDSPASVLRLADYPE